MAGCGPGGGIRQLPLREDCRQAAQAQRAENRCALRLDVLYPAGAGLAVIRLGGQRNAPHKAGAVHRVCGCGWSFRRELSGEVGNAETPYHRDGAVRRGLHNDKTRGTFRCGEKLAGGLP